MEKNQWVYFLKLGSQLPDSFFQLNSVLAKHGINLLPIELDQIPSLIKIDGNKFSVVTVINRFSDLKYFNQKVKKGLQRLHDLFAFQLTILSSFDRIFIKPKGLKNKNITQVLLPLNLHVVALSLSHKLQEQNKVDRKWIGGRSPRLSSEISEKS